MFPFHRYYCRTGAFTSTPNLTLDANICPAGYYCVEGTDEPVPCPPGTFSDNTKLMALEECSNCTKGTREAVSESFIFSPHFV